MAHQREALVVRLFFGVSFRLFEGHRDDDDDDAHGLAAIPRPHNRTSERNYISHFHPGVSLNKYANSQ